jgi:AhpD family alkylhydroperoxidase
MSPSASDLATPAVNTAAVHGPQAAPTTSAPSVPWTRCAVDKLAPHVSKAMNALDAASRRTALPPVLLDLVRLRASQINGCVYCVDTHSADLLNAGQSPRRVNALAVWQEAPETFFTERERAALILTEAATRLSEGPVTQEAFDAAAARFTETELAELIWVITVINAWNRLGATARPWSLD